MNKADLIEALAERLGDKKAATAAVEAVVDTVTRAVVKGEKVAIAGFGVFERVERAARTARNPATGAWRMTLRVERLKTANAAEPAQPIELRAFLQYNNQTLSETWTNLITP